MVNSFGATDYVLFGMTLLASAVIGLGFSIQGMRKKDSAHNILLGGGQMQVIPTAISLLVSFLSGVSLLGFPVDVYQRGVLVYITRLFGTPIAVLMVIFVVLPIFWRLKPTSVYEYLQHRFNSVLIRLCGSVLYLLFMSTYLAIVLYAPSIAMSGVTGVSPYIFFISVGVLCSLYTSFGGLKAVVWTDTLQFVFMLAGLLALFFKGIADNGGFKETFGTAAKYQRFEGLTNWELDPTYYLTMWTTSFGGIGFWFCLLTFNQISVQRYLSLPTQSASRTVLLINIPGYIIFTTICDLLGIVMFTYYFQQGCDPVESKVVAKRDQLVIHYSLDVLGDYPGMPGIFLACLFSGTLSTVSSGINSMAAVTWEDFFKLSPRYRNMNDPRKESNIIKGVGLGYGALAIAMSFAAGPIGGIMKSLLSVMGAIGGPLVGLFILGLFVPFGNKKGALVGLIVSIILTAWIATGSAVHKPYDNFALPTRVDNCTDLYNITLPTNYTASSMDHGGHIGKSQLQGFNSLYGLSPGFFSTLGILIVLVISIPVSYLWKDPDLDLEKVRHLTVFGLRSAATVAPVTTEEKLEGFTNISLDDKECYGFKKVFGESGYDDETKTYPTKVVSITRL